MMTCPASGFAFAVAGRVRTWCSTSSAPSIVELPSAPLAHSITARRGQRPRICSLPSGLGRDPASEKQAAKAKADETFGAQLPRYLAYKRGELKPGSFREVDRHLSINCRSLHARPIDAIDQRVAAILLAKISEDRGAKSCNNTRASGSGYFTWLMREGLARANPFAITNKAPENAPRDRTPSDEELREIWQACPDNQYGAIVRLLMLLARRRDEIASLRFSEIDLDAALITLPPVRSQRRPRARRFHSVAWRLKSLRRSRVA